jgi:hypothetical protein
MLQPAFARFYRLRACGGLSFYIYLNGKFTVLGRSIYYKALAIGCVF